VGVTMMQASVSDELSTAAVLLAAREAQTAAAHHFSSLPFVQQTFWGTSATSRPNGPTSAC
jgi:hypothetical protein